jgi:hypothetical protein
MTYPRAAIDPVVLQRLYERERSLRKVAVALQAECGITVSAPTVAAHLRRLGIEPGKDLQPRQQPLHKAAGVRKEYAPCPAVDADGLCGKPAKCGEFCAKHFLRWQRHGDPAVVVKRGRKG